jgi:SAM-dependent methyltransferase
MQRVPEPELMVGEDQAIAYSEADFAAPHQAVVDRWLDTFPDVRTGVVLDAGCGPADVTARLARALPDLRILGVDGSEPMLALGRARLRKAGLEDRVTLEHRLLPDTSLAERGLFDGVLCSSVLHHLHDPGVLWSTVRACGRRGAAVLVVDLARPDTPEAATALTERYAAGEPDVLREDFRNSLLAAFTVPEVVAQLDAAGLPGFTVAPTSDRHLAAWGRVP